MGRDPANYMTTTKEGFNFKQAQKIAKTLDSHKLRQANFKYGDDQTKFVSSVQEHFVPHDVTKNFGDKINAKALSINSKKAHFPLGNDDQCFQKQEVSWRESTPM